MDALHPEVINMSKVDFNLKSDYEFVRNYKELQKAFTDCSIDKVGKGGACTQLEGRWVSVTQAGWQLVGRQQWQGKPATSSLDRQKSPTQKAGCKKKCCSAYKATPSRVTSLVSACVPALMSMLLLLLWRRAGLQPHSAQQGQAAGQSGVHAVVLRLLAASHRGSANR